MKFDPELWLRIKNKKVTAHQINILSELAMTHSQTQAAANLGISVPVLHRHLKSLTNKLGIVLYDTTPNGTWLTEDGRRLLKIYNRYHDMLVPEEGLAIYCTPITYELLKQTLASFESKGKNYRISMNNDYQNIKALYLGRADMVLFDDPAYAIEFEGFKEDKILAIDIFNDTLVHVDNGLNYIRLTYGAQRLGFRYLEACEINYNILYEVSDLNHLLNSGKSFFINNSLIYSQDRRIKSKTDPKMFVHPIMAVSINPKREIRTITESLKNNAENN